MLRCRSDDVGGAVAADNSGSAEVEGLQTSGLSFMLARRRRMFPGRIPLLVPSDGQPTPRKSEATAGCSWCGVDCRLGPAELDRGEGCWSDPPVLCGVPCPGVPLPHDTLPGCSSGPTALTAPDEAPRFCSSIDAVAGVEAREAEGAASSAAGARSWHGWPAAGQSS